MKEDKKILFGDIDRLEYFMAIVVLICIYHGLFYIAAGIGETGFIVLSILYVVILVAFMIFGFIFAKENVLIIFVSYFGLSLILQIISYKGDVYNNLFSFNNEFEIAELAFVVLYFITPILFVFIGMYPLVAIPATGVLLLASIILAIIFEIKKRKKMKAVAEGANNTPDGKEKEGEESTG